MNLKNWWSVILMGGLALTLAAPAPALAWGDAPTHFSIGYNLVATDAVPISPASYDAFVLAAAAPDLAWRPLFRSKGLTYVHSLKFAESLLAVAKKSGNEQWLAMAYAWGAHVAADAAGHRSHPNRDGYIPEAEPLHSLVEVAVDTMIFFHFPPPTDLSWPQVNVSFDPKLLVEASVDYTRHKKRVPQVEESLAVQAIKGLQTSITAEYAYIQLKQSSDLSLAYLTYLADKEILPSPDFVPYYNDSVEAAKTWINAN